MTATYVVGPKLTFWDKENQIRSAACEVATCEPDEFVQNVAELLELLSRAIGTRYARETLGGLAYDVASHGL